MLGTELGFLISFWITLKGLSSSMPLPVAKNHSLVSHCACTPYPYRHGSWNITPNLSQHLFPESTSGWVLLSCHESVVCSGGQRNACLQISGADHTAGCPFTAPNFSVLWVRFSNELKNIQPLPAPCILVFGPDAWNSTQASYTKVPLNDGNTRLLKDFRFTKAQLCLGIDGLSVLSQSPFLSLGFRSQDWEQAGHGTWAGNNEAFLTISETTRRQTDADLKSMERALCLPTSSN